MAIDLQLAERLTHYEGAEVPNLAVLDSWITETFAVLGRLSENLTIRVVDEAEITDLNHRYRQKENPTNVLAFPFTAVAEVDYHHLGDIVICFAVVKKESNQQDKSVQQHFARMVIHGTLHLCGFDHQTDEEARVMEGLERDILAKIGIA